MGEQLHHEQIPAQRRTLQTIQRRIRSLVENSAFANINNIEVPEARFRITNPKNPKQTQIVSASIDVDNIVGIEIPETGEGDEESSKKLLIKYNEFLPKVYSVERIVYDIDGDEQITSEDSLTELEAQEFLVALNSAGPENEVDIFGQTRKEREENKAKTDTLRNEIFHLFDMASHEGKLIGYTDKDGGMTYQVKYMIGNIKVLVMRSAASGICVVDIQEDENFMYPIKDDGQDDRDPDSIVRPRLHYIIPSDKDLDQRIHYRVVYDPVEYGTVKIDSNEIHFIDEPVENIANGYEIQHLYRRLTHEEKVLLTPSSQKGPDDLQGA